MLIAPEFPTSGPDWQFVALWLLGLVVALVGAYAKSISARVTKLEADQSSLHSLVKGDYPTRQEINQAFSRLDNSLQEINRRLDSLMNPR